MALDPSVLIFRWGIEGRLPGAETRPMDDPACPADDRLRAFASGRLPLDELGTLAEHVERCPACQKALEGLEGQADKVELALRREVTTASAPPNLSAPPSMRSAPAAVRPTLDDRRVSPTTPRLFGPMP